MKGWLFDWKVMSWNAYVPFLLFVCILVYSFLAYDNQRATLTIIEILIPAFSAWWSIFIFQDILEEPGGETLLSYPVSRVGLGLIRVLVFCVFYVVITIIVIGIISFYQTRSVWPAFSLQIAVQCLLFSGAGYFLIVILKNCSWAMLVISAYVSFQVLNGGAILPQSSVYFSNVSPPDFSDVSNKLVLLFAAGVLFLVFGQLKFNKIDRFNE